MGEDETSIQLFLHPERAAHLCSAIPKILARAQMWLNISEHEVLTETYRQLMVALGWEGEKPDEGRKPIVEL